MGENKILVKVDGMGDPVENLVREDDIFQKVEGGELPDVIRFWVNSECLVRGRAKTARYGWYDEKRANEMGIRVVERSTGGGVVYHDGGNLNWSFFFRNSGALPSPTAMFDRASKYVVRALGRLGVGAHFSPPNRIDVADRKISGMAARSSSRALMVHGTLLLNSDLERLNSLCLPPPGCPPVANVNDLANGIEAAKVVEAVIGVLRDSGYEVSTDDAL